MGSLQHLLPEVFEFGHQACPSYLGRLPILVGSAFPLLVTACPSMLTSLKVQIIEVEIEAYLGSLGIIS